MDYEMILPTIAGASGVFAGIAVLYSKIRPRCLFAVNCWFCNKDTKVEYRHSEGWVCPSCEQYNGFTEDGDYNQDIPAQYCESLNPSLRHREGAVKNSPSSAPNNGFCQTCNLNQSLKVRALADYTPIHPENYDHEIEEYRKRLERTYAFCRHCEATLHQVLGKQDSWLKPNLISWRLKQSAENKMQQLSDRIYVLPKVPFYLHLARVLGLLIAVCVLVTNIHHLQQHSGMQIVSIDLLGAKGMIYLSQLHKVISPLIVIGLSSVLMAVFGAGKETLLVSDAVTSFVWVGLLALCSSKKLLRSEDYNSLQVLVSTAVVILTLWTIIAPRMPSQRSRNPKPSPNKSMRSDATNGGLDDSQCTLDASFSDEMRDLTAPPSPNSLNLSPSIPSTPVPPKGSPSEIDKNYGIDSVLESLKISTPYKNGHLQSSAPVSPRALFSDKPGYNPKTSDTYCIQRNIVSPPRLNTKNITQSSWVAGGYWGGPKSPTREFPPQSGLRPAYANSSQMNIFPLSRSSSQSSGYISHNSGFPSFATNHGPCSLPNSRQGSVCGDYERGSVFSEPAYKSWVQPMNINPSDSASQCSYSRGMGRGDAQSLYSCASVFSGSSKIPPPSPTGSTSYPYQEALGNISGDSNFSLNSRNFDKRTAAQPTKTTNSNPRIYSNETQRSPWFAFFLGMSFAANGFLVFLLLSHSDISIL